MSATYDITIESGADFTLHMEYRDPTDTTAIDLTGYTAKAQIRRTFGATSPLVDFTIAALNSSGQINLSLTKVQTAALPSGRWVWDLLLTSGGGTATRLIEGLAIVTPGVTQ